MKKILLALAAMGALTGSALAVPVSGDQQAQFLKTCVTNGGDQQLCTCKADAAAKIVDADFMQVILASMAGKSLDPSYNVAYNDYIVESTRACGMGM